MGHRYYSLVQLVGHLHYLLVPRWDISTIDWCGGWGQVYKGRTRIRAVTLPNSPGVRVSVHSLPNIGGTDTGSTCEPPVRTWLHGEPPVRTWLHGETLVRAWSHGEPPVQLCSHEGVISPNIVTWRDTSPKMVT